jgi:hypothetical protein
MSKKNNNETPQQPTRQAMASQNSQDTEFASDTETQATGVQTSRAGLANADFSNVDQDTEFAAENGIQAGADAVANRNANKYNADSNDNAGQDTEFAADDSAYDPARQATLNTTNNSLNATNNNDK